MAGKPNKTTSKPPVSRKSSVANNDSVGSGKSAKSLELIDIGIFFIAVFIFLAVVWFDQLQSPVSDSAGRTSNALGQAGHAVALGLIQLTFGRWGTLAIPLSMFLFLLNRWGKGQFQFGRWIVTCLAVGFLMGFVTSVMRIWLNLDQDAILSGYLPLWAVLGADKIFGLTGTILLTLAVIFSLSVLIFDLRPTTMFAYLFINLPAKLMGTAKDAASASIDKLKRQDYSNREYDDINEEEFEQEFEENENDDNEEDFIQDAAALEAQSLRKSIRRQFEVKEHNSARTDISPELNGEQLEENDLSVGKKPPARIQKNFSRALPPLTILNEPPEDRPKVDPEELEHNANLLEEKLASLKIEAEVVRANPGPIITRYDLKPAPSIKIARIAGLSDDIAMTLRARGVRILAPIPGEAAVGIEIPNSQPQTVYIREIMESDEFRNSKGKLTLGLGKDAAGGVFCTDLTRMPHLLVAGATGSGKSVCINTILASLLYRSMPEEVRIVLVDPKKVELSLYSRLEHHHLLAPPGVGEVVITSPENAVKALRSVHMEMERRYDLLAETGVRGLEEYNKWVDNFEPNPVQGDEEPEQPPDKLPYIVVIIDELADLMMTVRRDFEELVVRLAQMARAVGIHLVIATQRPSVDVVTGLIKANFPSRIAFQVASRIDSRTIIDSGGAEALLGRGDMLFMGPGASSNALRLHGALITTEEVEQIIEFVRSQSPCQTNFCLPDPETHGMNGNGSETGEVKDFSDDELFLQAAKIVVSTEQGSVSLLQRRLRVGYARAARLIDELEQAGVVGAFDGSKARQVLMTPEDLHERWGI